MRLLLSATLLLLFTHASFAQKRIEKTLKKDVSYLASDALEGRLAGSSSEKVAAKFIAKRFGNIGLSGIGANGFYHDFEFSTPIRLEKTGNMLLVDADEMKLQDEFYPIPISENGKVIGGIVDISYGIRAPELDHDDFQYKTVEDNIVLLNLNSPDGIHPHSKYKKYNNWRERVEAVNEYRPKAIICHGSPDDLSVRGLRAFNNLKSIGTLVVYVEDETLELLKKSSKVSIEVNLARETKTGRNVVAYLDNGGKSTVFIGAHYDHLGYGEYGNSRYIGEAMIHNGADDNASGVAMMLALAQKLKKQKDLEHNYVFIAFSAEELGLLGSKAYVNSTLYNGLKPTYMMNFDMVGRLNDKSELGIYGTGTSTAWDSILTQLDTSEFHISRNPSGMGSSDHTSFYLNKVPSIHFFTGTHEDYHKPSDDEDKINYEGMVSVLDFAFATCMLMDNVKGINYKKTKSGKSRKAPSFKVTLGIIPDYFGDAKGLKIDGVSPGKPAEKAGLQKGDIITKLGETDVKDMMTYMGALGKFDKGDKTKVEVIRANEQITFDIEF
ncbi:MAG: M20/M25/M40 family metallo-hydrolase [Bacteroidia bacterium]